MKKLLVLLALALLLVGCTPTRYRLTVEGDRDLLYESPEGRYLPDTQIVIKTHIIYDVGLECFVNGESIGTQTAVQTDGTYTHWEFYFTMPEENVTVTFETVGGKSG